MIELTVTSSIGTVEQRILLSLQTFGDWAPFFEAWGNAWRASRDEMWDTGGASTGTPWPMYSRATKEHRYAAAKSSMFDRRMTRRDLLRWQPGRERLKPSFVDAAHPENVEIIQGNRATYGSRVPYARNHDEGRGNMPVWAGSFPVPRRPLLTFGAGLELRTQELADRFAAAGLHSFSEGSERSGLSTAEVAAMLTGANR